MIDRYQTGLFASQLGQLPFRCLARPQLLPCLADRLLYLEIERAIFDKKCNNRNDFVPILIEDPPESLLLTIHGEHFRCRCRIPLRSFVRSESVPETDRKQTDVGFVDVLARQWTLRTRHIRLL